MATAAPSAVGNANAHAANSLNSWLDPLGPRWESAHGLSPAQLLRAEEALLPFAQQAEPFLAAQLQWAHADELPLTVRLLVAQGGSGKTRLAIELCARLRHDGWLAGFLVGDGNPGSMTSLAAQLRHCPQPVCIVVDYAETRTAELLALLAAMLAPPRTASTRILLLARSGGEWWQQLPARDARCEALLMGAAGTGPYPLPTVYPNPSDRDQTFQHALQLLATKLLLPMPAVKPNLRGEHFARPLYVQLAALMAALGDHAESAEALPRAVLNHEQRYWGRAIHSPLREMADQDAVRLMVLVTLLGEVAVPGDLREVWAATGGEQQVLLPLFRALAPLYPGRQGLQGLRPDLVGEALVAHAVLSINGPALLDAVLGASPSKARYAALTVLARASKQRADLALPMEEALERNFARCASEVLRVCVDTPNELPHLAKRAYVRLAPAVAQQIAGVLLPSFESEVVPMTGLEVEMRRTVHDAAKRRADKRNATINDKASFASAIGNLGEALRRDGKDKCALQFADQARLLFSELVRANRDRYEPDWAKSLNNYASHLSDAGRTDEALAFAKQALDIHQRLALDKPERYEPDWATLLDNYASHLSGAGRTDEALAFAKQAMGIHQRLALDKPERYEPGWATSLSNYASHLSDAGRTDEALAFAKQALDTHQRLALDKPERYEPDWATLLDNYANHLSDAGRTDEALAFAKQALDIRQRLALDKPERYEPGWATSLNNYANHLRDAGRTDEALAFAKQALDTHQRLALDKSERYEPGWATSLSNYASRLSDAGRTDEALAFAKQALDIRQRLALDKPERYEPGWATSLDNYANRLRDAGRTDEALAFAKQALDIRQRLALDKPERYEPGWATSLSNYASHLSDAGRTDEALAFAKQALDIRQRLVLDKPERYESGWATSLSNYASHLSDAGRTDEALAFAKQALDIHQRLALDKPERYEPDWATSLSNYASHLSDAGRTDEALAFAKQALDIRQRLMLDKPERYEPGWATSLSNFASHLSDAGRTDEALAFAKQALDIHQRLALDKPERYEPDWATSLSNYASHLGDAGRTDEALAITVQATEIWERLAFERPKRFGARARLNSLWALFLEWLVVSPSSSKPPPEPDTEVNPYSVQHVAFAYHALLAIFAQVAAIRATATEAAFAAWHGMHGEQREQVAGTFVLLTTLSAAHGSTERNPSGWAEYVDRYCTRRQGRLPAWLLAACTKLDLPPPRWHAPSAL